MRPLKKPWPRLLAAGVIAVATLAACSQFSIYDQFQPLSVAGPTTTTVSPLSITPTLIGAIVNGTIHFTVSGGVPTYTFTVLEGSAGGSITSSGVYTAPKAAGNYVVQVSDQNGRIANANVTVVSAPPLQISPTDLQLNVNDSYAFSASGGVPSYTFSVTAGGSSGNISSGNVFNATATGTATVDVSDAIQNTAGTPATVTIVAAGGGGSPVISPATVTMNDSQTLTLVASGGTLPYSNLTSSKGNAPTAGGSGHTWTFTSGGYLGNSTLTLTDGASVTATATVTIEPAAPSNLVATAVSSSEVDLTWTNNTSGSLSGINVYRAIGTGGFILLNTTALLAGTATSYQDTGLSSGTVYVYKVVAVKNGSGGPFTGTSNYAVATTQ